MRILGIDPGIGRMGWGIVDEEKGKVKVIAYDCLETQKEDRVEERLKLVFEKVSELCLEYQPEELAIEDLFFSNNAKTAFAVGQARGVVLLCAGQNNMPVSVYTPQQVKLAVTGYGKAEKKQVGEMVKMILKLEKLPKLDDTTDALAIALTHAFSMKLRKI